MFRKMSPDDFNICDIAGGNLRGAAAVANQETGRDRHNGHNGQDGQDAMRRWAVVLPPEAKLPEGATVEVTPLKEVEQDPPFLQAILRLAKPRDWPEDFALNHAHYVEHAGLWER